MIYTYIIIYIMFVSINSYIYKKKINFCNIIITLWTIVSILSMFGFYDMYIPNNDTYMYILFFIISFEVFCLFFYKVKFTKETSKSIDIKEENIKYKQMNTILTILICVMGYFAIQGIMTLISGGSFSEVRDAYLNYENFSNKLQMFISLVVVPLGQAIGIYAIIDCIDKKKIKLTILLFFVFLGELSIYTGGRGAIVNVALIIVIALMDKYNNNIIKIVKENKIIIITLIIIAVIIGTITLQRNLRGKGIIYNVYCYFVGGIHLLGRYIENPERYLLTSDNLLYGQILISGFSYPITFILRLFGMNIKAGLYTFYEITQQFVQISPSTTINNSVTMICYALRDFGVTGIFIYSALISYFFVYLYKKKIKENCILNRAMYYYFLKCAIFLFADFQFANTSTIFIFIYLILLYKFCVNSKSK